MCYCYIPHDVPCILSKLEIFQIVVQSNVEGNRLSYITHRLVISRFESLDHFVTVKGILAVKPDKSRVNVVANIQLFCYYLHFISNSIVFFSWA